MDKHIGELERIIFRFGQPHTNRRVALLETIARKVISRKADALRLHELLLCMLAYPENKNQYELADAAIGHLLKNINQWPDKKKALLTNSGIAGTDSLGFYSYPITRWIAASFPAIAAIARSDADPETVRIFFRQVLPAAEYEKISTKNLSLLSRIGVLKGRSDLTGLIWLINHLNKSGYSEKTRELLFQSLHIVTRWKTSPIPPDPAEPFPGTKTFFHDSLIKKFNPLKEISKPLAEPIFCTAAQKKKLLHSCRKTLASLARETDPVTFANEEELKLFRPGRGVQIVLLGMKTDRRYSLDSYIGYFVFKNGIALAYGGGWLFGERCQFGINILPPFRGGESAWICCRLLNVYHRYLGAKRFVVKPEQFGKNNPEALYSGAFWFYYKLGFTPEEKYLKTAARKEWKKKSGNPDYRTPVSILMKLSVANMHLDLSKRPVPLFDASLVSEWITRYINNEFKGDRTLALKTCMKKTREDLGIRSFSKWDRGEKEAFNTWSLVAQSLLHIPEWDKEEKKQFTTLVRLKGKPGEQQFIRALQQHKRFWDEITSVINVNPS